MASSSGCGCNIDQHQHIAGQIAAAAVWGQLPLTSRLARADPGFMAVRRKCAPAWEKEKGRLDEVNTFL